MRRYAPCHPMSGYRSHLDCGTLRHTENTMKGTH